MVKSTIEVLKPFFVKYPGVALLIGMLITFCWGYYSLRAADKALEGRAITREEFNIARDSIIEMKMAFEKFSAKIEAELKGLAMRTIGKESFQESVQTMPPGKYLVNADPKWIIQKYDSCLWSRIPTVTGDTLWFCYYHRPNLPDTFHLFMLDTIAIFK
jgi:hypothetical protein